MKIPYVTPDARLEHEFEKYSTDEPVERLSIARIRQDCRPCIPAIDHAMHAEFGVTQRYQTDILTSRKQDIDSVVPNDI
jgi:hypothetical protein